MLAAPDPPGNGGYSQPKPAQHSGTQLDRIEASTGILAEHVGLLARDVAMNRAATSGIRADLDLTRHEVQRLTQAAGLAPHTMPPPPREPYPSGHFDDFDDADKTVSGTHLRLTRDALDAHTRTQFESWAIERDRQRQLESAAAPILFFRGSLVPHVAKGGALLAVVAAVTALYNRLFHH
jgi:hypothetical protein